MKRCLHWQLFLENVEDGLSITKITKKSDISSKYGYLCFLFCKEKGLVEGIIKGREIRLKITEKGRKIRDMTKQIMELLG